MKVWHYTKRTTQALGAISLCLSTVLGGAASAETGHAQLHNSVADFVESFFDASELDRNAERGPEDQGRRVEIDISSIDPRLNLSVPVSIKIYEKVLVTTRPIARGEILTAADLTLIDADVSRLRYSYFQSAEFAIGMEAKRSLSTNATVVQEALEAPTLVKRGDAVVLSAKAGTVEIRQQGVAMQSGELGKRINVRNTNSDQIVQAVVTGLGEASVGY